jgi:D-aminopeptidase
LSGTTTLREGKTNYTASVGQETDLASPVTVTGDGYTVRFDGNNFASKHFRRIRRNSVSELTNPDLSPAKLVSYITEAKEKSVERWGERRPARTPSSTSTSVNFASSDAR